MKRHATKALALDPTLAEAHNWLAMALLCHEWDWSAAKREWERGLQLAPASTELRASYSIYLLSSLGQFGRAIAEIERARELEPLSLPLNAYVGLVCYFARQYDRAEKEARLTLDLSEDFPLAWWVLGMACEQLDRIPEAVSAFERAATLTNESSLMLAQLARACARSGDRERGEAILAAISAQSGGSPSVFVASAHAALGATDLAIDWLYRAYRERAPHLVSIRIAPLLDDLRDHPRFRELVLRLGLYPSARLEAS